MAAAITKGQVKMIHTLKGALGLPESIYRSALAEWYQVTSCKELTAEQAEGMIQKLRGYAVELGSWEERPNKQTKYDDLADRLEMASPPQLRKIEAMWAEVSRIEEPESRKRALRSLLERIAKVSDLRFLDAEGAGKVINALNAMKKKKAA